MSSKLFLYACVVLGVLFSGCVHRCTEKYIPKTKTYICKKAQGKITVDGKLSEPDWQTADVVDRFYEVIPRPVELLPYDNVKAYFLYDRKFLYVGAVIKDSDIVADPKHLNKEEETLFLKGDAFEVFIQPDMNKPTYYELHVNPLNVIWDARFIAKNYRWFAGPEKWDSNMTTAVQLQGTLNKIDNDQGWTVEIAIPLECFTNKDEKVIAAKTAAKWKMSVCLYDYSYYYDNGSDHGSRRFISSSKFEYLSFHLRQNFDFIVFE